jgi:uncharacterized protein
MMSAPIRLWSAAQAVLFALCLFVVSAPAVAFETSSIVIDTDSGTHPFTVEMAVTPNERGRGLMFRTSMAPDAGMLFDFGADDEANMWMQNTYLPLDMVFIEADGTVHRIAHDTTPFSTDIISSKGPVRAVLELNAGVAKQIGLKKGDVIHHKMFGNAD